MKREFIFAMKYEKRSGKGERKPYAVGLDAWTTYFACVKAQQNHHDYKQLA
jgi:hypothetical protein